MVSSYNDEQELQLLDEKIKLAEANGEPINDLVLRQIEILQQTLDLFLNKMEEQGRLNDVAIATIEIRQYSAMMQLAEKINAPTQKYEDSIKAVKVRIFGEDAYNTFFLDN